MIEGNPSRRDFLKLGANALGYLAVPGPSPRTGASTRPANTHAIVDNVILIVSDTLRRDALSLFRSSWINTPHLDRFAQQSVIFENALVSSFPTVLARNDILTGRYTFTYKGWQPIDADAVTLPRILSKAGILTSLIADTPHPFAPGFNYQRDFDVWDVTRGQEIDRYRSAPQKIKLPCSPQKLRDNGAGVIQHMRNVAHRVREEDYFPAQTMSKAAQWLEENNDGRRFFLHVDTFDPHEPWDPPSYYVERFDPGYTGDKVVYPRYDHWQEFLSKKELHHCRALYAGEVTMVDRWIGLLIDRIATLGLLRNTAIIFVSDHGYYLGEHGYIGKALIREDTYQDVPLYPSITRIPMLIYFPGCHGGLRLKALVQPVDLMPTILDLMGVIKPSVIESASLVPLLEGRVSKVRDLAISSPAIYYKILPPWQSKRVAPSPDSRSSITDGEWVFIYGPNPGEARSVMETAAVDSRIRIVRQTQGEILPELYNLARDPHCEVNLINQRTSVARNFRSAYLEFLKDHNVPASQMQYFRQI